VRRVTIGLVLSVLLATAACGGGGNGDSTTEQATKATIADVSVKEPFGTAPVIDFKPPVTFETTEHKIVDEGDGKGDAVQADSVVKMNLLGINASNGETIDTTWTDNGSKPITFHINQVFAGFAPSLEGAHAGDRVLMTVSSKDSFPDGKGTSVSAGDSVIFVVDIIRVDNPVPLTHDQFPTLNVDKDGVPTGFTPTDKTPKTFTGLSVEVLKKGDGAKVTANSTLTVNYLGQIYPDGKVFDESYSKKPATFALNSVIPGWTQGLTGQTVGSRVVLAIPPDLAYGAAGSPPDIGPDAHLIFVIDIKNAT
jgi:FKBP-type peptidyl-prolyl cis-trans isomerase